MAPVAAAQPPVTPFTLDYRLKSEGIPFTITATRTLRQVQGGLWKMEVSAKNWLGEIRETALFNWQSCTPQSSYYGYLRKGLGRVKEATLHLNRETGVAASERSGKARLNYPISDTATDELSVSLALQCALERGDKDIELDVADEKSVEKQRFQVVGEDILKIDGERLKTVKVQRVREANSPRQTFMWFAPNHQFLLVQLQQKNKDGEHVMTLQSLEGQ
ncbi:DUF3108 domain-containing protein [Alcanivorax sp. S6407]|uniref:DUF3108 domain-containing protein n=1 Tax=Alcanivorax sp. S6407 TaxID=2926424 RepID=UPI001FF2EB41|nr:DUF3108 domain-containing protein [Alcanivorax sp. S6407]